MKFKHISSLPSQFLSIDTSRLSDEWLSYSNFSTITDIASERDICEFVIPSVSVD